MARHANSLDASSNNGYSGIGEGPLQGSNVEREQPREDKGGVEKSDAVVEDSPVALPPGAFDTLDRDGDEVQTDDGAVAEVPVGNDGPVGFGRDAELDSRPLFEEREQARLQVSDAALSVQETSHTTREHESTMGMASSKKSEPHLASNINLAEDPMFLSVDTGRSLKRGREASSEGIQQEAAPNGHPLPASAQQDAMSAESLKQDDDGLDFCQTKLRSIRVRNRRLLAKHSDLFNQLESLYTDDTIRSAMPDGFDRQRRKFKIEQIPMPSQHDNNSDVGEQWLRWYACVVLQNARLHSTIERQECKIEDLREYKQLVDQAERAAQELLQRLLQVPTEAETSHEANVADHLANH